MTERQGSTLPCYHESDYFCYSGGSGSDEENDVTEQEQDKSQVTKEGEDISDDGNNDNDNNNEDDDNDDDDESEIAASVSAITVGELIAAMKTKKKKAAAPSQPSSVVSNLSISVAVSKTVLFSVNDHPDQQPGNIFQSISKVHEALHLIEGSSMHRFLLCPRLLHVAEIYSNIQTYL